MMKKYIKYVLLMFIFILIGALSMNFYAEYKEKERNTNEEVEVFVLSDDTLEDNVEVASSDDNSRIEVAPIA